MADFKRITDTMLVSPQITADDIAAVREAGVRMIINNRPDDEAPGQPSGDSLRAAAAAADIGYIAIPVSSAGFSLPQVDAMVQALASAGGPVLAFCRSGTRSSLLWALAQAKAGRDPEIIAREVEAAGYSVAPVRPTMDMLAGQASGG